MTKSPLISIVAYLTLSCSSPAYNTPSQPLPKPISPPTKILAPDNIFPLPSKKTQRQQILKQYEKNSLSADQAAHNLQHLLHQEQQLIATAYLEKLYGVKIPLLYERAKQPDIPSTYLSYCLEQKKSIQPSIALQSYLHQLDTELWTLTQCYADLPATELGTIQDFYQSLIKTIENIIQDISWPHCTKNPSSFHYDLTNNAYISYQERTLQEQAQ